MDSLGWTLTKITARSLYWQDTPLTQGFRVLIQEKTPSIIALGVFVGYETKSQDERRRRAASRPATANTERVAGSGTASTLKLSK
jgi:hypothetical protein